MYKANKSLSIQSLVIGFVVFVLTVFTSPASAEQNYVNVPSDANMMSMSSQESLSLFFDPNNYSFLVYNPGGDESSIKQAMNKLGIHYDERNYDDGNNVTPQDLATHHILIVGWNNGGYTSGLDANTLLAGITGRVVLTGHDLDFHTVSTDPNFHRDAAQKMLIQAINYVLADSNTGLITLGDVDGFPYLPDAWGISAENILNNTVNTFTSQGLASGVFDGLDPCDMCGWNKSYHDAFWMPTGSKFVPFELGNGGADIVTVAVPSGSPIGHKHVHNITKDIDYWTIQKAVDEADPNNIIVCDPYTFYENVNLGSKRLTIRSTDPNNRSIVESTVVSVPYNDEYNTRYGFRFNTNTNVTLDGLTIDGGSNNYNSIYGEDSTATIQNCILQQTNIGIYVTSYVTTSHLKLKSSEVSQATIGVYLDEQTDANIASCYIKGASSNGISAGYNCNVIVQNCLIELSGGSGITASGPNSVKIMGNKFIGSGNGDYGVLLYSPFSACQILDNVIYRYYTGIYITNDNGQTITVRNDTIANQSSTGIMSDSQYSTTITNSIIWGNGSGSLAENISGPNSVSYSCVQGITFPNSNHNINSDPCFVDDANANYHITANSPCRNSGTNSGIPSGEKDIDDDPRIIDPNVDRGADEYNPSFDYSGLVNFVDFSRLAKGWKTSWVGANFGLDTYDFDRNQAIDFNDLRIFAIYWLETRSVLFADAATGDFMQSMMQGNQQQSSVSFPLEESYSMESQTAALYLVYDGNMMPDPNDEITVQIHTDTPLLCMGLGIQLTGNAEIVTAMSEADCNSFGWDNGWNSDPYIDDVNNWLYVSGVSWESDANGTVGYLTFIYHSGEVSVSFISDYSDAFDADYQEVPISLDALVFGRDPNE